MPRRSALFLVYNLGCEMVFVLAQRLNSQNVPAKQAAAAIDKIISMLADWDLLTILVRPQNMLSHKKVKNIMEDVAQCSTMRLDPISMDKLWDLITMVLKWQTTLCPTAGDILSLTDTHLYEIERYVSSTATLDKLHRLQDCVSMLRDTLSADELGALCEDLTAWLRDFSVKVSLLIKLGLQTLDGKFVESPTNEANGAVLGRLGKNIYLSPESDRLAADIKERKRREISSLHDDLLGGVTDSQGNEFKFTAIKGRENNNEDFEEIGARRDEAGLQRIYDEFRLNDGNCDNNEYDFISIVTSN